MLGEYSQIVTTSAGLGFRARSFELLVLLAQLQDLCFLDVVRAEEDISSLF